MKLDWSVPGVPEDTREVVNWGLRKAMDELDIARDREAMDGPSAEPVVVLRQIAAARRYLEDAEKWAVAELRADDVPWSTVGDALGVTRQAAQMRFRAAVPERCPECGDNFAGLVVKGKIGHHRDREGEVCSGVGKPARR